MVRLKIGRSASVASSLKSWVIFFSLKGHSGLLLRGLPGVSDWESESLTQLGTLETVVLGWFSCKNRGTYS